MKKELLKAIKDNRLADYVSSNYWRMSAEELKDLTIQLLLTMYENNITEEAIDVNELLERMGLD